jgi:predicted membrane protein (TIGR00267 family)
VGKEPTAEAGYNLEGVAFGMTDGMICFLGIIIGVAEATQNLALVLITAAVGGIADAMGNSFGFFASQLTEQSVQLHDQKNHKRQVRVHSRREVWMSGVLSFLSTMLALAILIVPFFLVPFQTAIIATFVTGVIALFGLGMYVGKVSEKNMLRTGLVYAALGIVGALISYFVGDTLRHLTGIA